MRTHIKFGRIFGIEFGLHYSWFLIAVLIVLSLSEYFRLTDPQWGPGVIWGISVVTAILFFVTLLLHEFAHAVVAKARDLPVRSITLFALGGVAQIEKNATTAKTEFLVGIVGPLTSAVIGLVCLGIARGLGWSAGMHATSPWIAMLGWLGYINVALAVFNMIPGFPLDGGRVLRSIIWWRTGDEERSTRVAARIGQGVGILFAFYGLFLFFFGGVIGGLWMVFIGWFLVQVAGESYRDIRFRHSLIGVRVRDIMNRDCVTVDGRSDLQSFVEQLLLRTGRRCFVVEENGKVAGLVTPNEVRTVDRAKWPFTLLEDVMRPISQMRTVAPDTPVTDALEVMTGANASQLPVVSEGHLDGIISRAEVAQYFQTHSEMRA